MNYQVRRRQRLQQDNPTPSWRWDRIIITVAAICLLFVFVGIGVSKLSSGSTEEHTTAKQQVARAGFPIIEVTNFSAIQKQVLALAEQEYQKNPTGYDKTVMVYTEGFRESWCADFVSWIFNRAGTPFIHPETKYWRIPGVQTLKAYYEQEEAYHEVGDGYMPKMGDVAFYFGETPDGSNAEHVAMVLGVRGDTLVTIGGNETDKSIVQIRYDKLQAGVKGLTAIGASGIGNHAR